MAKGKKIKDKKNPEEEGQNESDDSMEVDEPKPKPQKKEAKPKPKVKASSDEDSSDSEPEVVVAKKPGFALLMDDSNDESSDSESEGEAVSKKKPEKKKKQDTHEDAKPEPSAAEGKGKQGKKAKRKKKKDDDDEDLEKVLAELELEYAGKKPPPSAAENNEADAEKENKKGKKKGKGKTEDEPDEDFEVIDGIEVGGTVKTAAMKRKEKKERQKQKQLKEKQKQPQQAETKTEETESKAEPPIQDTKPKEETSQEKSEEGAEEAKDEGDKKKKKKKKKDEEKEEPKKKAKGPGKGALAAMQEALKKVQEEQEKAKKAEEERIRKEEALEAERKEKKRLEEERKALKKQKEKEKKEQLRKEGKLLTAKQKAAKQKADAMLEAMRAQGMEVPMVGEKKAPRLGTRVRQSKKDKTDSEKQSPEPESEEKKEPEVKTTGDATEKETQEEEVKDSWDAESADEAVKDAWDEESVEEEETETQATASKEDDDDATEDEEEDEDDDDDDDDDDDESEESEDEEQMKRERAMARIRKRKEDNEKNRSTNVLRAPVVCVLGHVDTGKTKILDKLRRTHVQDGEAGGITQQIGATNVPIEVIKEQCKMVKDFNCDKLPGLLIIDTPGHESFSNLRDRGSSLCDIAILVVDIMHSLEPQTIESINLLKTKKTPFIIALNKIDRLYEWKANRHKDVSEVIEMQQHHTKMEFQKRTKEVITAMAEQGLNASLFYENPDPKTYISMVPTSAHSGDGMGNLMGLLVQLSQNMLAKRLSFSEELQATVLEVKAIPGLGTTIDVVLVNGSLREGQTLIVAGTDGPIVTQIKALLTPSKMQDLRVKNTYVEHKEIRAAQGVKICGKDLEKAIAGLNCLVAYHPDEVQLCKEEIKKRLDDTLKAIKLKIPGVYVQASTLGSLEALLEFLRTSKIPYAGVKIGPVVKLDVTKATAMKEHDEKYAVILAFDVKVERDAQELADREGIKIFQADIIYHLFDRFMAHLEDLKRENREKHKHLAVFPCKLRMLPNFVFNSRDPIVAGVIVEAGVVRHGTPLCVPSKDFLAIGVCTSIQSNHKEVETARKGEEVCVKIEPIPGESPKMFGRHFDEKDLLYSKISRETIDVCKNYFRDDLQKSDWQLMIELKKVFQIM